VADPSGPSPSKRLSRTQSKATPSSNLARLWAFEISFKQDHRVEPAKTRLIGCTIESWESESPWSRFGSVGATQVALDIKTNQSHSDSKAAILPVVLFGVDQHGKPTAARFPEGQARLAAKAAKQLDLRVLTVATPAVAELAATLPLGRIHASGKGFVPNVRGDIYAKLLATAGRRPQSLNRLC
jgi:hypothetical protein